MLMCTAFENDMPHPTQPPENARGSDSSNPAREHFEALRAALDVPDANAPMRALGSGSGALDWAASGAMSLTGRADGPPRLAAGAVASAAIAAGALIESLSPAVAARSIDWAALLGERAALFGHTRDGLRTGGGSGRLLEARDGWLAIQLPRDEDWRSLAAWLELEGDAPVESEAGWATIEQAVAAGHVVPLVDRARLLGLACAPAPHTPIVDAPLFRWCAESETAARSAPRPLRVLDLSTLWAGPLAASLLADAGASVLKIESPSRPDGARRGPRAFFDLVNANKHGAALDLRDANDRTRFESLLDQADVVVESARARAMRQLGYDAEGWVGERPGRIWCSITGYGRQQEWIAFGDDAAVAAGLAWSPDRSDDAPCFCGDALADPLTGLHAAAAILALARRARGGLLDLALCDVAAASAAVPIDATQAELIGDVDGGDQLRVGDASTPVAAPRSRSGVGSAPPLSAPTAGTIAAWADAAC